MSQLPTVNESPYGGDDNRNAGPGNTNSASFKKKRGPLSHITSFMSPHSLSFENERDAALPNAFPWQHILFANLAFAGVALLLYGTYCMFSSFFIPLLWGTIVALLLREVRSSLESPLISLRGWWDRLHAWTSPPDAVFALQLILGAVDFVAGIIPEWIVRFISFAFSRGENRIAAENNEPTRSRSTAAETPERPSFEPSAARGRSQRRAVMSTYKKRQRSPAKVEMNYRNTASYRQLMAVLVRVCCSWFLATSAGTAFSVIAVSAIVLFQILLKKLAVPFIISHNELVVYLSLLFNRFCLLATFVAAAVILSWGSSMGVPLMLYVGAVVIKERIKIVLKFVPLKSVVLIMIFFIATVIFAIALYVTLWNVYHEFKWMYNGARAGVASYLQFLPSDAVDMLTQQFVQWSNFSSISNAAVNFFKNDLNNGNFSRIWTDSGHRQNSSLNYSSAQDPAVLIQTYLGPSASWIPESMLVWIAPVVQRLHAGVHVTSLYSELLGAYNQLTSYSYVTSMLSYAKEVFMDFSGYSFAFFLSILLQSVSTMYNAFVFIAIFFTSSWYLLTVEDDPIASSLQAFSGMLNMKKVVKEKLADFLRHSVLRVAEVTLAGSAAAFLCTWLAHSLAMSQVKVLPSLVAAVFSALQLCPAQIVSLPCLIVSATSLWGALRQPSGFQDPVLQLLMFVPQLYIVLYAQGELNCQIYSSLSHAANTTGTSSPYWLSLFVAGGLVTFGLHGIIIGPLFFCVFSAMKIYYDYDKYDIARWTDVEQGDEVAGDIALAALAEATPQFARH